ncbi:MAG TPA: TolC family protein [Candidatus Saccharimonadales bacterium]|nr:TolC family protein [Candidatus Saccharimonadales bacterium]
MSVSRPGKMFHRVVASVSIIALLSSSLLAQTAPAQTAPQGAAAQGAIPPPIPQTPYSAPLSQYTRPYSILTGWKPYAPHGLPEPVLRNSDRLHSLIKDGKLMLSLNDAVALALENNFDIAIARYNLDIADMDLLRTKAGGTVRGVSNGLLTGTPGGNATSTSTAGSTGSGSGGTTTGTGGAASGSGGVVQSTQNSVGSAIDSYDPILTGTIATERTLTPVTNPALYGVNAFQQNTNNYNFNYAQGWATGTLAQVSYSNQRTINNIKPGNLFASTFNPELTGSWKATVRQHLLQGWGIDNNRRQIIIAENDRKVTDASFRAQVISTVAQIQNIYWDLVNAYEDLKVKQTALEFAQRTLSDNKKQVEIGTLAPIEVVSAQSSVAAAQQNLIVSQTNLQYQQLITKNALARNFSDPILTGTPVIPTDTMILSDELVPPAEELVAYALANRPELLESELLLRNGEINNRAAKNALMPTLDVVGFYGSSGLANNYGDVFSSLVDRSRPDKGAYVSLTVPLRNRAAQSDQIRSELEYRQNQLNFQQQKNQISLQVRNAAYALQQARAGVDAARAARDYAQQNLEAEQKKYALGASTSYAVLNLQSAATQAASNYVAALSTYEKDRVTLDQVTATTLERNGISMEDAAAGRVTHMPTIPGLQPNLTPSTVSAQPVAK